MTPGRFNFLLNFGWIVSSLGAGLLGAAFFGPLGGAGVGLLMCGALSLAITFVVLRLYGGIHNAPPGIESQDQPQGTDIKPDGPTVVYANGRRQ